MPFEPVAVRFVRPVGWRATATTFWGECAQGPGVGHVSRVVVKSGDGPHPDDALEGVIFTDMPYGPCEACGTPWDGSEGTRSAGCNDTWPTASGKLEPGCLYWRPCMTLGCAMKGPPLCDPPEHLHAVLPDGHSWDIDSRANNCTRPDEPHRCWVRRYNPETETRLFTVGKDGDTCSAGAGSIADGVYHGFLHDGAFTAG